MVAEDGDTAALHYRKIYILPLIAQHNGFFDVYERLPGKSGQSAEQAQQKQQNPIHPPSAH